MKYLYRKMNNEKNIVGTNELLPCSQASINSNGVITIRNYNNADRNVDEIIILTKSETEAIIELFKVIGSYSGKGLPF